MNFRARRIILGGLLLGTVACARRPPVLPPALFPPQASWTTPVGEPIEGPLAADAAHVYAATRDGRVHALDRTSGAVAWTRTLAPGTTVAAGDEAVLARQPDGHVLRLAADDGRTLWNADARIAGRIPPVIDQGRAFVTGAGVAALDVADGRLAWAAPGTPEVTAPALPTGPQVVVVEQDGTLRGRARDTGLPLWARRHSPAPHAVPIAGGGRLYVGTRAHTFLGLRARDGARAWRWRLGADADAPALLAGRRVIFATLEAVLYALERGNGNMAWRTPLPSRPLAAPLLVNGTAVVVACQESELVGFAATTGQSLGTLRTPGEMRTAPLLLGDRIVVGLRYPWVVTSLQLDMTPKKLASPAVKGKGGKRGSGSGRTGADQGTAPSPTPSPGSSATPAGAGTPESTVPSPTPSPSPSLGP